MMPQLMCSPWGASWANWPMGSSLFPGSEIDQLYIIQRMLGRLRRNRTRCFCGTRGLLVSNFPTCQTGHAAEKIRWDTLETLV